MSSRTPFVTKDHPRYKWVALSNTTLGMLMATINASIVLISLPAIFEGIHLDPLEAGNVSYLLWMLMGYLLVTAVLVVTFGRLGDMYGRVRIYNLGFVVFTAGSIALSLDPLTGAGGALWLIGFRLVQGVGGAMLFANSTAIITDAFPAERRGMALGINQVAAIAGSFIGLLVGGVLAVVDWRAVFWVSVPIGILGTVWSYRSLHETGTRNPGRLDWPGNITFAVGLVAVLTGITYGIQPSGGRPTGWTNPWVLGAIVGGLAVLALFVVIEVRSRAPMLDMRLFRIRAFSMGNLAGLLAAVSRGGLQFMLIIWLQGIWLPLHGYSYDQTPLWAGIYMLPITIGFLVAGPLSGTLSDRFGARGFATGGLVLVAATFVALIFIPVNFAYWEFAVITFLNGVGSGMFGAPNRSAIMSAVPAKERGAASGVAGTVQNAGSSLSIGVFFSLMVVGLASTLPAALRSGLVSHGVGTAVADQVAQLPPVGSLFAAFLGYNPVQSLLAPTGVLETLPPADAATLTGKEFFPQLISDAFHHGLVVVFTAAAIMSLIGAAASLSRGKRFVHDDGQLAVVEPATVAAGAPATRSAA
ncbi:MFS transporter [Luteimicrobium subarcticum]|uniref:MFS transporter n=1 Tax=Luteimicrobium subarcticum TaxID=620910 RepID=A0A2M8WTA2_9MICO|nr:MFS transporter [Luteimicrobium subarcticum]PJI94170.1 MFS transporter [Luteimicrobium subarcticum]